MKRRRFKRPHLSEALEARLLFATVPIGFTETRIGSGLFTPTSMVFAPDGRLFVSQISGEVKLVKNNALQPGNVLTVNEVQTSEQGLLGLAVDPNFGAPGGASDYLYAFYAVGSPTIHNRVSRFLLNGDVAGVEQPIIDLPTNIDDYHQGGALSFGGDGKLYVTIGDMGNSSLAQSLTAITGKVLRFNSDGSIPADNPFVGQTNGIFQSIWARGLRNPFTTAWQPGPTGALYINDVGENAFEEINLGVAGANYGWPTTEGTFNQASFPTLTNPISVYGHAIGQCIVGGAFYEGAANTFPAQFQGKYFFADFVQGWIKYMDPTTKLVTNFATGAQFINNLRLAPDGALWYLRGGDTQSGGANLGEIYRIQSNTLQAPAIAQQPQSQTIPIGESVTFDVSATGTSPFTYRWQRNSIDISGATGASYTISSVDLAGDNGALFRCIVSNSVSSATSNPATLTVTTNTRPVPTIVTPITSKTYAGGNVIHYSGAAMDAQDGVLDASQFTWRVDFHHDTHAHPFISPTSGSTSGQFTAATVGEVSANVWYRITLTVVDSAGLTQTTSRDVMPRTTNLTLTTNIAGLALSLDGQPIASLPSVTLGVEGGSRSISASPTQIVGGVTYEFVAWSDGGAAQHAIEFPSADQTITAYYRRASSTTTYLSDLNWLGNPTNGWGPVERDRSNGESGAADGQTITLNGVTYTKGLGAHAASSITYNFAAGTYQRFMSDAGVDDEIASGASVVFQVFVNNVMQYTSGTMTSTTATKSIDLDVSAATSLRLVLTDAGNGNNNDHGDWANARFTSSGAAPLTFTGTMGSDTWTFRMNPAHTALDVLFNSTPLQSVPIASLGTINVNGLGGDDTLVIDLVNGPILGVGQIRFDGGANGSSEGDGVYVIGTAADDTFEFAGGSTFVGALPITYVNCERAGASGAGGNDIANVNATLGVPFSLYDGAGGADTIAFRNGANTLSGDVGSGAPGVHLRIDNSANVTAPGSQHIGTLTITGNGKATFAPNGDRLLNVGVINLTGNGAIDLNDNDLVATATSRAAIESYLQSGAIFSTLANNRSITALGLLTGAEYLDAHGSNFFHNEPVAAGDVLLKYTYLGDVDFNGQVDTTDYNILDFGFLTGRSGWANGDVDYNGQIDTTDYNLIDFAFLTQSGVL